MNQRPVQHSKALLTSAAHTEQEERRNSPAFNGPAPCTTFNSSARFTVTERRDHRNSKACMGLKHRCSS